MSSTESPDTIGAGRNPDIWMSFYWRDYFAKTTHLSTIEHGAYLLLIGHAWMNGGTIPAGPKAMQNITRMTPREWKASSATLCAFFYTFEGGYRHHRVDIELAKATRNIQNASAAGQASAAKRWGKTTGEKVTPVITPVKQPLPEEHNDRVSGGNATSPSPSKREDKEGERLLPNPKQPGAGKSGGRGVCSEAEFDIFYGAYPRKVGKEAARKAFIAARRKVSMPELIAGLKRFAWPADPQYCPHPATWLNAGRWSDEVTGDPVLRAAGLDDNGHLLTPETFPQSLQLESTNQ